MHGTDWVNFHLTQISLTFSRLLVPVFFLVRNQNVTFQANCTAGFTHFGKILKNPRRKWTFCSERITMGGTSMISHIRYVIDGAPTQYCETSINIRSFVHWSRLNRIFIIRFRWISDRWKGIGQIVMIHWYARTRVEIDLVRHEAEPKNEVAVVIFRPGACL